MTEKNPLSDAEVAVAADVLDAVDPALTQDQRINACERAAGRDPQFALLVATQLLFGVVDASPDPAARMARLRACIGTEETS